MWLRLEGDAQTHAEPVADGHFCRYFPSSLATATNPIRIAYVSGRTIGVSGVRKYRKKPERQGPPETKYWLFSDRRCLMRLGARWCPTSQLRLPIQNDPAYQISTILLRNVVRWCVAHSSCPSSEYTLQMRIQIQISRGCGARNIRCCTMKSICGGGTKHHPLSRIWMDPHCIAETS